MPPLAVPVVLAAVLLPCPPRPNCVSTEATDPRQRVEPLPFTGAAAAAQERLRVILRALPRTRVVRDEPGRLEAECTSKLFRFVDDVTLVVDPAGGVVHLRSASRTGWSDLGVNRRRVETIRARFLAPVAAADDAR